MNNISSNHLSIENCIQITSTNIKEIKENEKYFKYILQLFLERIELEEQQGNIDKSLELCRLIENINDSYTQVKISLKYFKSILNYLKIINVKSDKCKIKKNKK